jgi:hypothetical protein
MPAERAARPGQDRDRIDRAIEATSWLGALAMFAYGAALSFDVLHTIAQASGLSPLLAWLWPLGFETFMAVAAVAVLAEQRARPGRTPWYPWVLTALAAGSSIALNFGHPYLPLDPPPRLLVACVYGVPPITAPFAWHLFLQRVAHRRRQHTGQPIGASDHTGTPDQHDATIRPLVQPALASTPTGTTPVPASTSQDGASSRAVVRVLLAHQPQDSRVSWQDVQARTGLSRSRAYTLLREERARLAASNGHQPTRQAQTSLPRSAPGPSSAHPGQGPRTPLGPACCRFSGSARTGAGKDASPGLAAALLAPRLVV